jgi:mono/diheme cytochrome c family protein
MTKGIFQDKLDGGTQYLFANMPYYQFSNLTAADSAAIVAYLRTVTGVAHTPPANGGTFATRPTTPQWAPVALADLPSPVAADGGTDGGTDAGAASTSNGKYMAALMCSTCHTVNTAATAPLQLDATKAYQGGKTFNTTVTVPVDGGTDGGDGGADAATTTTVSKQIQSMNLTPDTTGLKTWTAAQIVTAIKQGKDEGGRTICSPMRPFPNLTDKDAMDIAAYLQAIAPATNAITMTCE